MLSYSTTKTAQTVRAVITPLGPRITNLYHTPSTGPGTAWSVLEERTSTKAVMEPSVLYLSRSSAWIRFCTAPLPQAADLVWRQGQKNGALGRCP